MKFKIVFAFSLLLILGSSCKKCEVYYVNTNKSVLGTFAQMEAEDYLRLDVTIKRNDALFVRNIQIIPITDNFPKLHRHKMTSFLRAEDYDKPLKSSSFRYQKIAGHQVRMEDFYAEVFDLLPKYNRLTNIGTYHITYSTFFRSDDLIEMETFKVLVIVTLMDPSGKQIIEKETVNFKRMERCWTSTAFH